MSNYVYKMFTDRHTDFAGLTLEDSSTNIPLDNLIGSPSPNCISLFIAFFSIAFFIDGVTIVAVS